jgi:hypothetical protein
MLQYIPQRDTNTPFTDSTVLSCPHKVLFDSFLRFLKQNVIECVTEVKKGKAVPLHAMEALGRRGGIAPTHSRPRH